MYLENKENSAIMWLSPQGAKLFATTHSRHTLWPDWRQSARVPSPPHALHGTSRQSTSSAQRVPSRPLFPFLTNWGALLRPDSTHGRNVWPICSTHHNQIPKTICTQSSTCGLLQFYQFIPRIERPRWHYKVRLNPSNAKCRVKLYNNMNEHQIHAIYPSTKSE